MSEYKDDTPLKFKVRDKVFNESFEAYEYCVENEIPIEEISEVEEVQEKSIIEESPEENPSQEGAITEQELQDRQALEVIAKNWTKLSSTEKEMVVSVMLGKESGSDKRFADKSKFQLVPSKTSKSWKKDVGLGLAQHELCRIQRKVSQGSCPFCGEHYTQERFYEGMELPENLAKMKKKAVPKMRTLPSEKQGATSFKWCDKEARIKLTVSHIGFKHPDIAKLPIIQGLFPNVKIPQLKEAEQKRERDFVEEGVLQHQIGTGQVIRTEAESLSKEQIRRIRVELNRKARRDPSFREKILRSFILKEKETKSQEES